MKAQMEERIVSQPATQSQVVGEREGGDEIVAPVVRQFGAWKKVKLGEVCVSIADGDHQAPPKAEKGVPFVTISDIDPHNCMDFTNTMFVTEEYYNKLDNKRKPQKNDVLYSVVGSFGKPVFIKEDVKFVFQRHIAILRPNKERVNPMFMYYTMLSKDFYHQADAVALGAAQRTISLTSLRNMVIALPPRSVQDFIATTLSRYDALIANYQRQIKLLEEAAQRLYKEWFVDLRFPGHESVKVTDGVPEGWRSYNIDDVFDIKYGKNLSTKEISSTGKYPVYGANGIIGYYNKYNCEEPVVLITSRGNGSGDVLKTYEQYTFVTNNSFVVKPKAQYSYCTLPFTFGLMCSANFRSVRTGAAQPQLTNASIHHINIVMPPCDIIKKYCSMMEADYKLVRYLRKQLTLLTESRDRLLPKLMSGEIEL